MENLSNIFNKTNSPIINKVIRGNFTKVSNHLLDSSNFNGYEKMVLISLERYNYGKNKCWASQETIARCAGFSKTKIKNVLNELEKRGKVIKIKDKKYRTNTYYSTTNIYRPPDAQRTGRQETNLEA